MLHQNDFDSTQWQFLQPQFLFLMVVIHNIVLYCGGIPCIFSFSLYSRSLHTQTHAHTHPQTHTVCLYPSRLPTLSYNPLISTATRQHTKHSGLLQPSELLHGFDGLGQGLLGLKLPGHWVRGWEVAKLTQPVLKGK